MISAALESKRKTIVEGGLVLPGSNTKTFDFLGFLVMRTLPILLIGSAIFLFLLPFIWFSSQPQYEVQGRVRIERDARSPMGEMPAQTISYYFQDFVRTQARLMEEGGFLLDVMKTLPANQWPAHLQNETPVRAATLLKRNLRVDYDNGTEFLIVTLEGPARDGMAETVNAVMEEFKNRQNQQQFAIPQRSKNFLLAERKKLQTTVDTWQAELDNVVQESASANFDDRVNPVRVAFIEASATLDRLRVATIEAENNFTEASNRIEVLRGYSLQPMADELTAADPSLWGVRSWTYQTLQTMRSSVDGIAEGNPDRKYVDANMAALVEYEKNFRKEVEERHLKNVNARREYDFAVELTRLNSELVTAQKNEQAAASLFGDLGKEVERFAALYWRGMNLKEQIKNAQDDLDTFSRQILVLDAEMTATPRVSVVSKAATPTDDAGQRPMKNFLFAIVFAYGLVGAIYFAFDYFDNRIRSPHDVQTALGVSVASSIRLSPPPWRYDGIVNTDPSHPAAASLRSLAYKIDRECRQHGSKMLLFTGLESGNGETATLRNLTSVLGRMSMRVALVDFNSMNPGLSAPYAGTREKGVRECLMGLCTPDECRIENFDGNQTDLYPFIGPPGSIVSTREAAQRFFAELRARYDIILMDTPPVLISEQTVYLAQHSDAAIIMLRVDHSRYRDLRKAMTLLGDAGVRAISAVLNFDEARNPVASFIGTIQKSIDTISETWRLIWIHWAAYKTAYRDAGSEPSFKKPLRRMQWLEFKRAWRELVNRNRK